jgi:hypothetical protein
MKSGSTQGVTFGLTSPLDDTRADLPLPPPSALATPSNDAPPASRAVRRPLLLVIFNMKTLLSSDPKVKAAETHQSPRPVKGSQRLAALTPDGGTAAQESLVFQAL